MRRQLRVALQSAESYLTVVETPVNVQMNSALTTICDETKNTFVSHDKKFLKNFCTKMCPWICWCSTKAASTSMILENLSLTVSKTKTNTRYEQVNHPGSGNMRASN